MRYLQKRLRDQKGQGMTEYIIIAILIAIVVIVAVRSLGTSVSGKFNEAAQAVDGLSGQGGGQGGGQGQTGS